jgi:DNA modification methylase
MTVRILQGDSRELLKSLQDASVHCCVRSPPYYGLRDYGVDGQIGLEQTPEAYIAELIAVFREVRRVLRKDGTLWLNMGDSYAGSWGAEGRTTTHGNSAYNASQMQAKSITNHPKRSRRIPGEETGVKPKDLYGMPWMLAFALRADGWYLRQDIIWSKPNPMPESVRDRCTKAHEYLFLLSKSARYHFDQGAVAEAAVFGETPTGVGFGHGYDELTKPRASRRNRFDRPAKDGVGQHGQKAQHREDRDPVEYSGRRNKRSVWTIPTSPYADAHFATFPPDLVAPCILAGCPVGGAVLDPFGGAGTTGLVADRLQRDALLIELNPKYARMARERIEGDAPLFAPMAPEEESAPASQQLELSDHQQASA